MNAWYDDIVEQYGEYCLESTDGRGRSIEGDNSSRNECQDDEPNGSTRCENVELYGGCEDWINGWYFSKYCRKTCRLCEFRR